MNRTDRLLAIVLELQAKGSRRAQDLAATFETSVRTIYRDVQALSEAGVPVISVPGQGYSLMEGYFLPPLRFSPDEATMLLLGGDFVAQNLDAEYRNVALSANRKIEAVLPESLRDEVHYLQSSIRFVASNPFDDPVEPVKLQQLRRAIIARKTVRFHYEARFGSKQTREANPYGLVYVSGAWYIIAYDHARHDLRSFRLDRIDRLVVTDKTFTRPHDFSLERRKNEEQRNVTIRALFDREVARWVHESRYFFRINEEETAEGLVMTLRVRQEEEALQWLLSWGAHVRVLEPASLRNRIAKEAEGLLRNHRRA